MATLEQKVEAETRMRAMLKAQEMPQPDEVQYGEGCIRLLWHEQKICLVIDIDDPANAAALGDESEEVV